MTKNNETERPQGIKTKWYKSALLPWFIIWTVAVLFAGVWLGHLMRSEQIAEVRAAAYTARLEASKTVEQK